MKARPIPSGRQLQELTRIGSSRRSYIIGIDEVGLGACAGPLVVAGVLAAREWDHAFARDSKKLTPKQREKGYKEFVGGAPDNAAIRAIFIAEYDAHMVDYFSLGSAHRLLTSLVAKSLYDICPAAVVLDGDMHFKLPGVPAEDVYNVVKADEQVPSVSAASVIAKVHRDTEMDMLHEVFNGYSWNSNKGYLTSKHFSALRTLGVTVAHRFSYNPIGDLVSSQLWQFRQQLREMPAWTSFLLL